MPIYDYTCTVCNRTYDQLESLDAPKEQACIDCGGLAKRTISVPAKPFSSNTSSHSEIPSGSTKIIKILIPSSICPICNEDTYKQKRRDFIERN